MVSGSGFRRRKFVGQATNKGGSIKFRLIGQATNKGGFLIHATNKGKEFHTNLCYFNVVVPFLPRKIPMVRGPDFSKWKFVGRATNKGKERFQFAEAGICWSD